MAEQQPAALTLERTGALVQCCLLVPCCMQAQKLKPKLPAGVTVPVEGASRLFVDPPAGHVLAATPTTVACYPLAGGPSQVLAQIQLQGLHNTKLQYRH